MTPYYTGKEEPVANSSLFAVPKKGYIDYRTYRTKSKKVAFSIKYYPDDVAEKGWTYKSSPTSQMQETATFMDINENMLITNVSHRVKHTSKEVTDYIVGLDVTTGEEVFKTQLDNNQYNIDVLRGFVKEETGDVAILGLYYDKGQDTKKNEQSWSFLLYH